VTREVTVQERANGRGPADPKPDSDPAEDSDSKRVSGSARGSDPSTQEHES
jgi:hypothetical protein